MKKKILFIMDALPLGGIAKSLLALFYELGEKYDIDLLLMIKEGIFLTIIPNNITLLDEPIERIFRNPNPKYIFKAFLTLKRKRKLDWIKYSIKCTLARISGGLDKMVCVMDESISQLANPIHKQYDAAIAYQGGRCIYYLVNKINAKKKMGFVHSDYASNHVDNMLKPMDKKYFAFVDYIATISPICLEALIKEFPEYKNKFCIVENICSPKNINSMAKSGDSFTDKWDGIRITSMGRLVIYSKGLDLALEACKILIDEGYKVRWYFIGDGDDRINFQQMIFDEKLNNNFILLGAKVNPYSYILQSDIFVHPSRIEGKSVALDEVKALLKPIVVTNFTTVNDQFIDNKTALIANMNARDISNKIKELINDPSMAKSLSNNLNKEKLGNEEQVKIFEHLMDL